MLLEDSRGPGGRSGILICLAGGLGEGLKVRCGRCCRVGQALGGESLTHCEELLVVSRRARLERLDLGKREEEGPPGIGFEPLFLQHLREGVSRLHMRSAGTVPIGAGSGQQGRPACALIQGCSARVEGVEVRALCLHTGQGCGQRGFALLERGREGRGVLARAREGIREPAQTHAFLLEGGLDLGNLRGESLELRDDAGGPIPLGLERRCRGAGHLVELGDTAHEVLVACLRVAQRVLRAVSRLVELGDLFARDVPVGDRRRAGVLRRPAHGTGRVLLELARERRGALRDPQVVAVRRRGVRELRGGRGLAQLVRRAQEGRAQQVRLHGGIQALVDGAQCGRGLRQRVGVRTHETQGLGGLLDAPGQRLTFGLDRRDARQCLLAAGAQRLDLRA